MKQRKRGLHQLRCAEIQCVSSGLIELPVMACAHSGLARRWLWPATRIGHGDQRNIFISFFFRNVNLLQIKKRTAPNHTINHRFRHWMGNHTSSAKSDRSHGSSVDQPAQPAASGANCEAVPKIQKLMKTNAESVRPVLQKQLSATAINFDDFRSPGMKRTPLLERRNLNNKGPLCVSVQAVQAKPKQLFMDPRSPTIPRTPVPTDR